MQDDNSGAVRFCVELDEEVAWELAQFIKRSCFGTYHELTEAHLSEEERNRRAYLMIAGVNEIQKALSEAGVSPR